MADEETPPYVVEEGTEPGTFHVVIAETGRILLVCRDRGSAEQYSLLLCEAYARGERAGRRKR